MAPTKEKAIKEVLSILNKEFNENNDAVAQIFNALTSEQKAQIYAKTVSPEFVSFMSDADLVMTALDFFRSDLNVSEASRDAFLHRNTLIYRLDKISKLTGYDLRVFEDSWAFKLLMVIFYEQAKNLK